MTLNSIISPLSLFNLILLIYGCQTPSDNNSKTKTVEIPKDSIITTEKSPDTLSVELFFLSTDTIPLAKGHCHLQNYSNGIIYEGTSDNIGRIRFDKLREGNYGLNIYHYLIGQKHTSIILPNNSQLKYYYQVTANDFFPLNKGNTWTYYCEEYSGYRASNGYFIDTYDIKRTFTWEIDSLIKSENIIEYKLSVTGYDSLKFTSFKSSFSIIDSLNGNIYLENNDVLSNGSIPRYGMESYLIVFSGSKTVEFKKDIGIYQVFSGVSSNSSHWFFGARLLSYKVL